MQNQNPSEKTTASQTQERLSIGKASKFLGVSIDTLRRWENKGIITAYRSPGGHRYFLRKDLEILFGQKYTRVAPPQPSKPVAAKTELRQIKPIKEKPIEQPESPPQPTPEPIREEPVVEAPVIETPVIDEVKKMPQITPVTAEKETPPPPVESREEFEKKAKEIIQEAKVEKKRPTSTIKIIIIVLVILSITDIILLIIFLTSSQTIISPIP